MKHLIQRLVLLMITVWFCQVALAQEEESKPVAPKWTSNMGYWIVEGNKKTPKEAKVFFYNNDHSLVYEEVISGQKLKLNKKKTLLRLKAVLEEAVISYANGNWSGSNNLLAAKLRQ